MTKRPLQPKLSDFPFRQVHLDFHTSEHIPGVGVEWSKEDFQGALRVGRVASVTLFAKCHHGWSYHETKVGARHPQLSFDLLDRQVEACREIGVRCPLYVSAGLDERMASLHPEWLVMHEDGTTARPFDSGWFRLLSFDTPYLDYLCAQIEEVARRWPDNDGIFLDIVAPRRDYREAALKAMRAEGVKRHDHEAMDARAQRVLLRYYERATAAARCVRRDLPVFHNAGHVPIGARKIHQFNSHFELESLPTGGWGYDHFPVSAAYALTQNRLYLGMTGKFHTFWGEFGGFKRPAALKHECAAMLAWGARCSIGDQLHPRGRMNADTYRLIGEAYAEVEAKEPWCGGVRAAARIAVVSAERDQESGRGPERVCLADEGAVRMLLELHLPFVVLDRHASWRGFDLVVVPDGARLDARQQREARAYLRRGGKLIGAVSGLLDEAEESLVVPVAVKVQGKSEYDPDYLVATKLAPGVPVRSPIVVGGRAWNLRPGAGAKVLAERRLPYFNRTWEHFCSHQHAPDAPGKAYPGMVGMGGVVLLAHDLFTQYREVGQPLLRDFFAAALDWLLEGRRPVRTSLPTAGRFNLLEQPKEGRYVAHLLYVPKLLRGSRHGRPVEIIEDLVPLREVAVEVRLARRIRRVTLEPQGEPVAFTQDDGVVRLVVPEFVSHQMVVLHWRD